MNKFSLKLRLTSWYALFIIIIVGLMMGIFILNDELTSNEYYYDKLFDAAEEAAREIHTENGKIILETQTETGVRVMLLNDNGELVIGRRKFAAALREGVMRTRNDRSNDNWYLLDKPIDLDGTHYWIRCYISSALSEKTFNSLLLLLIIMIPLLVAIVLLGGYHLTKKAFYPLDKIIRTASGISTSGDLHHRFSAAGQYEETKQLAYTLDAMMDRISHSIENEKQFISDASHELRTPLSVICTQSEYALMPGQSVEEKNAALETILSRSRQTSEMIAQLLMLSRMDYQKITLQFESIDLSALIQNLASEMQQSADEKHIRIECRAEDHIIHTCDELLIMRMLVNLVDNAIRYGKENGSILLLLNKEPNGIRIEVADDGIGISAEDLPNIWRRFYRVNKFEQNGAGLGLSIVQSITEQHHGTISVKSELNKGTVFSVFLPDDPAGPRPH